MFGRRAPPATCHAARLAALQAPPAGRRWRRNPGAPRHRRRATPRCRQPPGRWAPAMRLRRLRRTRSAATLTKSWRTPRNVCGAHVGDRVQATIGHAKTLGVTMSSNGGGGRSCVLYNLRHSPSSVTSPTTSASPPARCRRHNATGTKNGWVWSGSQL